jgi:hypothetical protein
MNCVWSICGMMTNRQLMRIGQREVTLVSWCSIRLEFVVFVLPVHFAKTIRHYAWPGSSAGPKWDLWRTQWNDLYSPPNILAVIKLWRMWWAGHVARMGERLGAYRVLRGRPEGRRLLGRPRHRWEHSMKLASQEVGWGPRTGLVWLRVGTRGRRLCSR